MGHCSGQGGSSYVLMFNMEVKYGLPFKEKTEEYKMTVKYWSQANTWDVKMVVQNHSWWATSPLSKLGAFSLSDLVPLLEGFRGTGNRKKHCWALRSSGNGVMPEGEEELFQGEFPCPLHCVLDVFQYHKVTKPILFLKLRCTMWFQSCTLPS